MGLIFTRVRTTVHPYGSFAVPCKEVHVERNEPLRRRIDISPNSNVPETTQRVIRSVRTALIFLDNRYPIRVPAVGAHSRGVVDGYLEVVAQLGARSTL